MNLLFAIDDNFVHQLETVLLSIHLNTAPQKFNIYILQKQALKREQELRTFCENLGMNLYPLQVDEALFKDAPVTDRYPTTIYYRLLAHQIVPEDVHKILYLDADLLCINDLSKLYEIDLGDNLFGSAIHSSLSNTTDVINRLRLQNFDADGYYNSGVLLMNLDAMRRTIKAEDIFSYIRHHILLLPDQDVLNALYSDRIKTIPDQLYNFDTRNGRIYEIISNGKWTLDWVIKNTVILHYCGRDKPWLPTKNSGRFTALYKQYFQMTSKRDAQLIESADN